MNYLGIGNENSQAFTSESRFTRCKPLVRNPGISGIMYL